MGETDHSIVAIIPLYNGARWIEEAIASVLAQTLQPDEFIVVDDGSTDGGAGAAIVERLAKQHPITLLHKSNGGQSSARNFAVAHSRSALIALLDQDDAWYPHHLETLVNPFRETRGLFGPPRGVPLGWTYSDLDEIDETGGMVNKRMLQLLPRQRPPRSLPLCLQDDMFILPSASLISRRAFEAIGGFDERLCGYEDDDVFLRMFRAGYESAFIDEPLSQWRIFLGSTSHTRRMLISRMIYAQKLFEKFPDEPARRIYLSRDYLAPRFLHQTLISCTTAIDRSDAEMFRLAMSHLHQLRPHLSLRRRLIVSAGLFVFGRYWLARNIQRAEPLLRRAFRLVSAG